MAKQVLLQWLCFYLHLVMFFWSWFRTIQGSNFSPAMWHKMNGVARAFHTQYWDGTKCSDVFSLSSVQSRRIVWKWALFPRYSWRFWGSAASVQFMFLHWFQQKLIHFTWAQMTSLHCLWRAVCWICYDTRQRGMFHFFRPPFSLAYRPPFFCKRQNQSQLWDSVRFWLPHSEADSVCILLNGFQWLDWLDQVLIVTKNSLQNCRMTLRYYLTLLSLSVMKYNIHCKY